ncbi:MAG: MBL fold metallo-hydrolase [Candidatus Beckwithbacteria bacterium]|nr:MBL fold metallo-hydrolase [Patescibacteria group bacterium]
MDITYLGHSGFLLKFKSTRVVCDPFFESVGFKLAKIKADIVTISHQHKDHNNSDGVEGEPMIINGPGEYEIKGVAITGISTFHDDNEGKDRGKNVVYTFQAEDLRICHLGDLGHELSEKTISQLGDLDVLLIPVGGVYTIDLKQAVKVIKQISPSIVIPMHYRTKEHSSLWKNKATCKEFIDEIQMEPKKEKKLTVKKLDLPEELSLVVLERYVK